MFLRAGRFLLVRRAVLGCEVGEVVDELPQLVFAADRFAARCLRVQGDG
jgi:hypothetical protein